MGPPASCPIPPSKVAFKFPQKFRRGKKKPCQGQVFECQDGLWCPPACFRQGGRADVGRSGQHPAQSLAAPHSRPGWSLPAPPASLGAPREVMDWGHWRCSAAAPACVSVGLSACNGGRSKDAPCPRGAQDNPAPLSAVARSPGN